MDISQMKTKLPSKQLRCKTKYMKFKLSKKLTDYGLDVKTCDPIIAQILHFKFSIVEIKH